MSSNMKNGTWSAALLLVVLAMPAAAQTADPRVAVSVGAGAAYPFHGDLDFTAAAWQVAVRGRPAKHFLVEAFFDRWRNTSEDVFENIAVQGPSGVLGRIARVTTRQQRTTDTVGINGLATTTLGRARIAAGGGIGQMVFRRRYTTEYSGCDPAVITASFACEETQTRGSSGSLSVQAVGALDVSLLPRVAAFGQVQLLYPVRDFGSGHVGVIAGIRASLF
jgi:hypothetical protein